MSREALREELQRRIAKLGSQIVADEEKLLQGSRPDKVDAAGEIAALRGRQAELERRLAEVEQDREPEGGWDSFKSALERDLLDIDIAFQRWARKYH